MLLSYLIQVFWRLSLSLQTTEGFPPTPRPLIPLIYSEKRPRRRPKTGNISSCLSISFFWVFTEKSNSTIWKVKMKKSQLFGVLLCLCDFFRKNVGRMLKDMTVKVVGKSTTNPGMTGDCDQKSHHIGGWPRLTVKSRSLYATRRSDCYRLPGHLELELECNPSGPFHNLFVLGSQVRRGTWLV